MDKEKRKIIRKKCCRCGEVKSGLDFWIDNRNPDGLSGACGECVNNKRRLLWRNDPTSRLKYIYNSIKQRCNNKTYSQYKHYGGRGIKCIWNNNEEFVRDMLDSYVKYIDDVGGWSNRKITIDRIDNNGNYCKENCRWVNRTTQVRNKTCSCIVDGKSIQEWSDIYNIPYVTIRSKIKKGLSIKEIINTPNKNNIYGYLGYDNMSLIDIARKEGISVNTLYVIKGRRLITIDDINRLKIKLHKSK